MGEEGEPVAPPYDEVERLWHHARGQLQGECPPGPELVASAIADALEADQTKLRHPVGADAEMIIALRDSMGYEEFVGTVREMLGIEWRGGLAAGRTDSHHGGERLNAERRAACISSRARADTRCIRPSRPSPSEQP